MKIPLYQVDAFCKETFSGNPAAVCPLENWLDDELLLNIALENNLSETAFFIPEGDDFHIRWFTPGVEVKLCGHATLATAHILYTELGYDRDIIKFNSLSGMLEVKKNENGYTLNFPSDRLQEATLQGELFRNKKTEHLPTFKGDTDYVIVLESEEEVLNAQPNFEAIARSQARGLIITAKGNNSDFVYRFFAPQSGVNEDPATGSAQTTLVPFWAKELGKNVLSSIQLSQRRGYFTSEYLGERVNISGKAITFMSGEITL